MSINLLECDGICHSCIKSYANKHKLQKGEAFKISCNGIPKNYISDAILAEVGGDRDTAIAMIDPVTWANKFLDWHCVDPDGSIWQRKTTDGSVGELPKYDVDLASIGKSTYHRPYQAEALRCSSQKKISRWGRQSGKCLVSGTLVQMADGSLKAIESIIDGDEIACIDQDYQSTTAKAHVACNSVKSVAKITLMDGREIEATLNHPFLTRANIGRKGKEKCKFSDKWTMVSDLMPGDYIAVPTRLNLRNQEVIEDKRLIDLIALFVAEGNLTSNNCRLSNSNPRIIEKANQALTRFKCSLKHYKCDADYDYHVICQGVGRKHLFKEWLKKIGLYGLDSHQKYLPNFIMTLCNEDIARLLSVMYGCDGWASLDKNGKPEIGYCTVSELLAKQIIALLARLGIYANVRKKKTVLNGKVFYSRQICINQSEYIQKFGDRIGIFSKEEALEDVVPAARTKGVNYKTDFYKQGDVFFVKVRDITYLEEKMTWDLTVPSFHNFIANNIVSHNTESLSILILYKLFVNRNFKVVIICPYQSQIDLIFGRVMQFIRSSTILYNSVARNVKAPQYTIELYNGSSCIGFSCVKGTKIVTRKGLVNIEGIRVGDIVLSLDTDTNGLVWKPVSYVFVPNHKKVYKVKLFDGHEVTVSKDHPFWTKQNEWRKLKDLKVDDRVVVASDFKLGFGQPDDLGYLLGLILGDGSITEKTLKDGGPRFTSNNPKIQASLEDVLSRLKIDYRSQIHGVTGSKEYTLRKKIYIAKTRAQDRPYTVLSQIIYDNDLQGLRSHNKYIPNSLFNRSPSFRAGLLKGLLETDGHLQKNGRAGFSSTSKKLAYNVRDLLNSFGIKASVRKRKQAGKKIKIKTEQRYIYPKYDIYEVGINSKFYTGKLLSLIDLSSKKTYESCLESTKGTNSYCYDEVHYSKIRSIEYCGKEDTYDLSVGVGTDNFIANGIVLHNTAGTRSGLESAAARGQSCQLLIFDEADYLSRKDMESALAIIINFPDATVWMSSTPTGKREKFYENCHSNLYREFHYPSQVNPNWTEKTEETFRAELTEEGYNHEVLAIFSEQEEGVYKAKYVEVAQADYQYEDMVPSKGWVYMLGVDWNDYKIGTTFIVVGHNPDDDLFYIVDKQVMSRSDATHLAACQKVAELNRLWQPAFIYVDQGYGHVQVEVLHKFGADAAGDPKRGAKHPDTSLSRIVKGYMFGGTIESRDLFTKQPIKKPAKPFLVENSVRRFESLAIKYPKSDKKLTDALLGYIVKRTSISGSPIYEQQNESAGDHFLDALNLALVAFTLEKSEFGKPNYDITIAFTGQLGEPDPVERKETTKPATGRASSIGSQRKLFQRDSIPGANTTRDSSVKIWSWDGFEHDTPKPKVRSLEQAFGDAERRIKGISMRRGPGRPRRNKF